MRLTSDDHERVEAAIAAAEARTSGEIFCVLDTTPGDYPEVAYGGAAIAALTLPVLAVLLGWDPAALVPAPLRLWNAPELAAIEGYAALQAVIFVAVAALLRHTPLGRLLAPRAIRREHVHAQAMRAFLAHGLHETAERTGVLIFASLPDRHAEIIADAGIYERVTPDVWGEATAALVEQARAGRLADGFVAAIGIVGDVLAAHFPPRPRNPNELEDRLVEL